MNVSHGKVPPSDIHPDATDIFVPAHFCGYVSAAGKPGQPGIVLHIGCEEPTKGAYDDYVSVAVFGFLLITLGIFVVVFLRER